MPWKTVSPEWAKKRQAIVDKYELTGWDESRLMTYKAERERGLVHTEEWHAQMAELQARFDQRNAEIRETFDLEGTVD